MESSKVHLGGVIARDLSCVVSNYRANMSLDEYLKEQKASPSLRGAAPQRCLAPASSCISDDDRSCALASLRGFLCSVRCSPPPRHAAAHAPRSPPP